MGRYITRALLALVLGGITLLVFNLSAGLPERVPQFTNMTDQAKYEQENHLFAYRVSECDKVGGQWMVGMMSAYCTKLINYTPAWYVVPLDNPAYSNLETIAAFGIFAGILLAVATVGAIMNIFWPAFEYELEFPLLRELRFMPHRIAL